MEKWNNQFLSAKVNLVHTANKKKKNTEKCNASFKYQTILPTCS